MPPVACKETEEEINEHLSDAYSDREEDLPPCSELIRPPEPSIQFNTKEPTLAEVREIIRGAWASAAPGPSGVPYRV